VTGHHKCPKTTRFKDTEGGEASNDCEEADNASKHFRKVYNRSDAPVDFSALEEIEQREILDKLDEEPTMLEIVKAIKVMRSDVAPGESGVIGKCLKHCSGETIEAIHEVIKAYWNYEQENPQWKVASLSIIYKGREDHKKSQQPPRSRTPRSYVATSLLHFIEKATRSPIALYGTQA
jgi:hypothetical protein